MALKKILLLLLFALLGNAADSEIVSLGVFCPCGLACGLYNADGELNGKQSFTNEDGNVLAFVPHASFLKKPTSLDGGQSAWVIFENNELSIENSYALVYSDEDLPPQNSEWNSLCGDNWAKMDVPIIYSPQKPYDYLSHDEDSKDEIWKQTLPPNVVETPGKIRIIVPVKVSMRTSRFDMHFAFPVENIIKTMASVQ